MMDKKSIPDELDVFISLLGEIDMIKNQLSMLDKNTHVTLSQNNVSALLGNAECFRVFKNNRKFKCQSIAIKCCVA